MSNIEIVELTKLSNNAISSLLTNGTADEETINVSKGSVNKLGIMLATGYCRPFETFIGKCNSLRVGMDFIVTPKYPRHLLQKNKLVSADIKSIPNNTIKLVNYTSVLAMLVYDSISSDKELLASMKENDKPIISYSTWNRKTLGKNVRVIEPNSRLNIYTHILRIYSLMLKTDTFTPENVYEVVKVLRNDSSVDVFHNTTFGPVETFK